MTTRRKFIGSLVAAIGVILLPLKALAKKVAFKLSKAPKLQEVGGSMIIRLKGKPVLFVRDAKDSLKAVHAVCSHRECTVGYNRDAKRIECPCHSSAFGLDGRVQKGPAAAPLTTFPAEIKGDRVVVTLE